MDIPSIKNEDQYEALRDKGYSKKKQPELPIPLIPVKKEERLNPMKNGLKKRCMNKPNR